MASNSWLCGVRGVTFGKESGGTVRADERWDPLHFFTKLLNYFTSYLTFCVTHGPQESRALS